VCSSDLPKTPKPLIDVGDYEIEIKSSIKTVINYENDNYL
jgi:hypothetical protein